MSDRLLDRLASDRWWDFVVAVVVSGYSGYLLIGKPWPWGVVEFSWVPVAALGTVAAVAIGLRVRWRRWPLVGFLGALLISMLTRKVIYGWYLSDIFIFPFMGWWIWQAATTDAYADDARVEVEAGRDEPDHGRPR